MSVKERLTRIGVGMAASVRELVAPVTNHRAALQVEAAALDERKRMLEQSRANEDEGREAVRQLVEDQARVFWANGAAYLNDIVPGLHADTEHGVTAYTLGTASVPVNLAAVFQPLAALFGEQVVNALVEQARAHGLYGTLSFEERVAELQAIDARRAEIEVELAQIERELRAAGVAELK
jgi:hypothetical protein